MLRFLLCLALTFFFPCVNSVWGQIYLKPIPGASDSVMTSEGVKGQTPFYLDLQKVGNVRRDEPMNDPIYKGDNLKELPTGIFKTRAGIPFQIGEKLICLRGKLAPDRPDSVKLDVDRTCSGFYFLQGCGWGSFGGPANPAGHFERDGTAIGMYIITYEDQDVEFVPITYGKDVRDWWGIWDKFQPTKKSEVAWRGTNDHVKVRAEAKGEPKPLRLFMTTWRNPWPTLKIKSIEFVSEGSTAAPFCVAITGYAPPESPAASPEKK
ncbi:MAG: hypothetical protein U0903_08755 [Planctomycetales bacterium]